MESQTSSKSKGKVKISARVSFSKNDLTISLNEEIEVQQSLGEQTLKDVKRQMISRNADLILELFSDEEESKKK